MEKTAVVLGFFDGLHPGHISLIEKAVNLKSNNLKTVAYIFDKHPAQVTGKNMPLIMSLTHKKDALLRLGIDRVEVQKIDSDFLNTSPQDFVKEILLQKLGAEYVITGENYTFGKGKSGNPETLSQECKKYGIKVICMPSVRIDGDIISSTVIRGLIENGDIKKADSLMSESYEISGEVVLGRQDGRKMGFPTANILPPDNRVLPRCGVYSTTTVVYGKSYPSVTNVGYAPTFGGKTKVIETNIRGFDGDLYGRTITVKFIDVIRFEKKFNSIDELKAQIDSDVRRRMEYEKCNQGYKS